MYILRKYFINYKIIIAELLSTVLLHCICTISTVSLMHFHCISTLFFDAFPLHFNCIFTEFSMHFRFISTAFPPNGTEFHYTLSRQNHSLFYWISHFNVYKCLAVQCFACANGGLPNQGLCIQSKKNGKFRKILKIQTNAPKVSNCKKLKVPKYLENSLRSSERKILT